MIDSPKIYPARILRYTANIFFMTVVIKNFILCKVVFVQQRSGCVQNHTGVIIFSKSLSGHYKVA